MEQLLVRGGRELRGKLELPKAKNSVLPILAAALLCEGESRICKVPALRDVDTSIQLLRAVGGTVQKDGDMLTVSHNTRLTCTVPKELSGAMRSSVYYMVPLLLHGGAVRMPLPCGCRIGARQI
ncbi:MAG: UDP-N-acetylglucosamine 1-carboxyvinyltransferase, partial [Pygmaiobacter sp.]